MKGRVHSMNLRRGMVAIATEGYGFTIIELLGGDELEVGDLMEWSPDTGLGRQRYHNLTKNTVLDVFAQNHWVPLQQLRQQLLF